jgi:uncharacterized membrane protein
MTPDPLLDDAPRVSAQRAALSRSIVQFAQPMLHSMGRHWLFALNTATALLLGGAIAAPLLLMAGLPQLAEPIYELYHTICHQWAMRSFFLFGNQWFYTAPQLTADGLDPHLFVGNAELGWKLAFCERDTAIFVGLLLFGGLYAARWRRYNIRHLTYVGYALLAAPMAFDGFTQLFGLRESTWELRVATGLLFGLASAWFLYPRFDKTLPQVLTT